MAEKGAWRLPAGTKLSLNGLGEVTAGKEGLDVRIEKDRTGWYMRCNGRAYVMRGRDNPIPMLEGVNRRCSTTQSVYNDFLRSFKQYRV